MFKFSGLSNSTCLYSFQVTLKILVVMKQNEQWMSVSKNIFSILVSLLSYKLTALKSKEEV